MRELACCTGGGLEELLSLGVIISILPGDSGQRGTLWIYH